jgi:hypothetical protein
MAAPTPVPAALSAFEDWAVGISDSGASETLKSFAAKYGGPATPSPTLNATSLTTAAALGEPGPASAAMLAATVLDFATHDISVVQPRSLSEARQLADLKALVSDAEVQAQLGVLARLLTDPALGTAAAATGTPAPPGMFTTASSAAFFDCFPPPDYPCDPRPLEVPPAVPTVSDSLQAAVEFANLTTGEIVQTIAVIVGIILQLIAAVLFCAGAPFGAALCLSLAIGAAIAQLVALIASIPELAGRIFTNLNRLIQRIAANVFRFADESRRIANTYIADLRRRLEYEIRRCLQPIICLPPVSSSLMG